MWLRYVGVCIMKLDWEMRGESDVLRMMQRQQDALKQDTIPLVSASIH